MTPRVANILWLSVAAGIALALFLSGCSTPGAAGFRELARSNARERTALKAVAVHAAAIGQHVDRAQVAVGKLAKTKLSAEQSADLAEIKVQLQQVTLERDNLTAQISGMTSELEARSEVLRNTRIEAAEAARASFWAKVRFSIYALGFGFIAGAILTFIFRATLHGAVIGVRAYLHV
jgi:hypothetical protein